MGKFNEIQQETTQSWGGNSFTTTVKSDTVEFDSAKDKFTFKDAVEVPSLKVNGEAVGAQVQADWNQTDDTKVDYIKNRPSIKASTGVSSIIEGFIVGNQDDEANIASGDYSHAEGCSTSASGDRAHAEGYGTTASDYDSHAEGYESTASSEASHAEGIGTTASNEASHAEGNYTTASAINSHAEGDGTTASGDNSHAEGEGTEASSSCSHSEGYNTTASGVSSHSEGDITTASGDYSHAEGSATTASGMRSHAEGDGTTASGDNSHAEGEGTTANHAAQHVFGTYNIADPSSAGEDEKGTYVEIVGNGTDDDSSNARTLDWSGNEQIAGTLRIGSTSTGGALLKFESNALKVSFDNGSTWQTVTLS